MYSIYPGSPQACLLTYVVWGNYPGRFKVQMGTLSCCVVVVVVVFGGEGFTYVHCHIFLPTLM